MGTVEASQKVADAVHHHENTIRRWKTTSQANGEFPALRVGKYEHQSVIYHEEVQREAAVWTREQANVKEMPTMTVQDFCQHLNNDILLFISSPPAFSRKVGLETARKFLHDLGFERVDCGKGGLY